MNTHPTRGIGPKVAPTEASLVGTTELKPKQLRAASVHVADRIAAEHPHPLDDEAPRLAGRLLAADPLVRAGLRELLDQLGITRGTA
jgi:hypothetical protein